MVLQQVHQPAQLIRNSHTMRGALLIGPSKPQSPSRPLMPSNLRPGVGLQRQEHPECLGQGLGGKLGGG